MAVQALHCDRNTSFHLSWQRQVGSLKNRHGFAPSPSLLDGGGGSCVPWGLGMDGLGVGDPTIQLIFMLAQWGFLVVRTHVACLLLV